MTLAYSNNLAKPQRSFAIYSKTIIFTLTLTKEIGIEQLIQGFIIKAKIRKIVLITIYILKILF
jgi:hypothetical protein